jgi:hypothetical protein
MPGRASKCTYKEGGRRCPFPGAGQPALCKAHQIAIAEASKPRRPFEVLASAFNDFLAGKPINVEATIGAAEHVLGGQPWSAGGMGADYRPDVHGGESEDDAHQRAQGGRQAAPRAWPPWGPPRSHPHPPPPDPNTQARHQQIVARQTLGFAASEPLTEDLVRKRRARLARKYHPDMPGGSTQKMAIVNDAADVLLATL